MLHRTWLRTLAALLLAGGLALTPAPAAALGATVSPDLAPPGTRLSFTAPGFVPNELVRVTVHTPQGQVVRFANSGLDVPIFADGAGVVSWSFVVPAGTPDGLYLAEAVDVGERVRQRVGFIVQAGSAPTDLAPPSPTGDVTVRPEIGPPGSLFVFRTSGFAPLERVGIWLHAPDGSIADLTTDIGGSGEHFTDRAGGLQWFVRSTPATPDGRYIVVAAGTASRVTKVAAFSVRRGVAQAQPVQTPNASVNPQSGPPGTSFAFTASGFMPGEGVGIWIHRPDGQIATVSADGDAVRANELGVATWSITAGTNLPDGVYAMVSEGMTSTQVRVVRFEIRR
jgi:hypothetical protein